MQLVSSWTMGNQSLVLTTGILKRSVNLENTSGLIPSTGSESVWTERVQGLDFRQLAISIHGFEFMSLVQRRGRSCEQIPCSLTNVYKSIRFRIVYVFPEIAHAELLANSDLNAARYTRDGYHAPSSVI